MSFCGLNLSVKKRGGRSDILIRDSCFPTMVFSEVKGFKCVVRPTFETRLKKRFGSLELSRQNCRKGFFFLDLLICSCDSRDKEEVVSCRVWWKTQRMPILSDCLDLSNRRGL